MQETIDQSICVSPKQSGSAWNGLAAMGNNMTFVVRAMQEEDIPAVVKLEKHIFSAPWSEKSFLDACASKDNIYLVSVLGGVITGYCGVWVSFETADLCNIAVASEYRRQGIAQELLREALRQAEKRGVERLLLEVRQSNEGAIRLYYKFGFEQFGIRRGYYSEPMEDAVLMQLVLSH